MPRRVLDKILPHHSVVRKQWFLRPFRALLGDPALWATHRRNVLRAMALGILISFIPFPIHTAMAAMTAVYLRVNIPVAILASWFANPVTMGPLYYAGYRLGLVLLGQPTMSGSVEFSLAYISDHLDEVWAPLLLGCLVLGIACAFACYALANWLWIKTLRKRFRRRRTALGDNLGDR
jgi:uncharacterized protein (DUF2062 family)